jgi:lipopolysaccharide assembly outer membrane protein LptD (OstA)
LAFRRAAAFIAVLIGLAGFGHAQPPADTAQSGLTDVAASTDSVSVPTDTAKKSKSELADTVHYEADFIDYDNEERVLSLMGRARVRYQNITLQADTIVYTVANDLFQARGKPQLVEGRDTTVGDFMAYNIKTRRGRVSYAFTRFDDTYVTGNNIVKTRDNRLYIEQGDYTTCQNPQHPHYYFYGRHILAVPDDKVVGRPVVMNIGDAPVAVLPYFVMPLRRGRRSGWLTPSWGGSVASGGYIDNLGYYYAPNDYTDATLAAKAQEFNSFVFNATGRYNLRYTLDGEVSGRYVIDNRLENASQQWALDYRHNQLLSPDGGTRLSGYGSLVSNRTFNRLYSDETYELERQQLDANMSLSHRLDAINASTNLVWRRNHNLTTDKIVEDMPMFDFRLQNRAFLPYRAGGAKSEPAWYNNIYYAYDTKANMRREAYGNDSLNGFIRPGMEHNVNLTSTQKILKYLNISPYVNIRASMFYGAIDTLVKDTLYLRDTIVYRVSDPDADTRAPDYTLISAVPGETINGNGERDTFYTLTKVSPVRKQPVRDTLNSEFNVVRSWNTGVNLSTRLYGLFPINALGITALRHTLTPTVGYSFSPKHELDRTFYNVGISYAGPRTKAEQLLTFSLSNTFQGKRTVFGRAGGANNPNNNTGGIISGINNGNGIGGNDSAVGINNRVNDNKSIDTANRVDNDGGNVPVNNVIRTAGAADTNNTVAPDSINTAKKGKNSDVKREEKFDILTLSMNTAYNMEADTRRWRDLSLNASTGISILNASFSSGFWFYNEADELTPPTVNSYSVDLTSGQLGVNGKFWDGDLPELDLTKTGAPAANGGTQSWNIGFSPSFSYRANRSAPSERFIPTKSFNVSSSANINLTKSLSARWNGNYDFSSDKFSHNSFDFHYDMECWEMRFSWRPEKINPGFSFVVNVKKIPDIKWEQNETKTTRVL